MRPPSFVADCFRLPSGDHRLNVARHAAKVDRQLFEKFTLVDVGGQLADPFTILSFDQQLFEPRAKPFLGLRARAVIKPTTKW